MMNPLTLWRRLAANRLLLLMKRWYYADRMDYGTPRLGALWGTLRATCRYVVKVACQ
jgi:hypothetical protein